MKVPLSLYEADPKTVAEIKADEVAPPVVFIQMAWAWLLFKEGEFNLNETEAAQRRENLKRSEFLVEIM
ncbi:MAG: hypothetical protein R2860_11540 [Desulfobacterales bacterium]